jgi:tetratricopeptide (TPR) repeat protein
MRTGRATVLAGLGFALASTGAPAQAPPVGCNLQTERWAEIVQACSRALAQELETAKDRSRAYNVRGWAQYRRGSTWVAVADFSESIRLDPDYHFPWSNRSLAYFNLSEFDRSIADASRAIELRPDFAPAWNHRASSLHAKGDLPRAKADIAAVFERGIATAGTYSIQGWVLMTEGQLNEALNSFDEALRREPRLTPALTGRGLVFERQGERERARRDYEAALAINPSLTLPREGLARVAGRSTGGPPRQGPPIPDIGAGPAAAD